MNITAMIEVEVPDGDFCNRESLCDYFSNLECSLFSQKLNATDNGAEKCARCKQACRLSVKTATLPF